MRTLALSLSLLLATSASATSVFEGSWFICLPELAGRPSPYALVEVTQAQEGFSVVSEWGSNYAASGNGVVSGGRLIARGCTTFRGEVAAECTRSNAPIFFTLSEAQARKRHRSVQAALRKGLPVRTTSQSWQSLAPSCEAVVDQQSPK